MSSPCFTAAFFDYFTDLSANNDKAWFEANRARYEAEVKTPLTQFVAALAEPMRTISPHIRVDPKKSVFRIHRDVRFSKDKSPYKTNAGLQFRHVAGKDAHVPGFYLHLEPGQVFYGGGVWKPPAPVLRQVREAIVERPDAWRAATASPAVIETFGGLSEGDPLQRAPQGFDLDHPLIGDLKKRSFFVMKSNTAAAAGAPTFLDEVVATFSQAAPAMRFLTEAVGQEF